MFAAVAAAAASAADLDDAMNGDLEDANAVVNGGVDPDASTVAPVDEPKITFQKREKVAVSENRPKAKKVKL